MIDRAPDRREINAIYRQDFHSFAQRAFHELEPGTTLAVAPYLETLAWHLEETAAGRMQRLITNMPPRHLKSIMTTVIWVAWLLAQDSSKKIAIICHSDHLAADLALRCKRLIESDWYRSFAPNVRIRADRDKIRDFETTAGGGIFAASIESGITGRGFDIIILDDPQAASTAGSEVERQRVIDLFDGSIASRLNDQVNGVIIVVQQRLHDGDLSGYLLERSGWQHLNLPLIAVEEIEYLTYGKSWKRPIGDILCPERIPADEIDALRARLGTQIFETQYQQSPSSVSGEEIKPEYLGTIPSLPASATRWFVSVDTAAKALVMSDFTVFLVIATDSTRHYVAEVIRVRVDVAKMRDIAIGLYSRFPIEKFLIEDSASGPSLQSLMHEAGRPAHLVGVGGKDKLARLRTCMHLFVENRIYIVGDAPWTAAFRDELVRFPVAKYDDQVDALTLYLEHATTAVPVRPVLLGARTNRGFCPAPKPPNLPAPRKGEHPMRPRTPHLRGPGRF